MQGNDQIQHVLISLKNEMDVFAQAELRERLVFFVRNLLLNDFNSLVQILYKVDVDENLLRSTLAAHPDEDAAELVTDLLVSRELQKRNSINKPDIAGTLPDSSTPDIPDDEKW
ncbi:MAG: hypothetical protein ACXWV0_07630 [Flavisolibacter sp.]